jgi:hypothetical protein
MPDTPITFEDVERLSDSGFGGNYRIGERTLFVGSAVPLGGTTVYRVGEIGRLVLPRWFAETNGLTRADSC